MHNAENYRIVFVTTDSFETSLHISRILVTENLAACCNILQNVISVFAWQGNIHERHENVLMIKTSEEKLEMLEQRILELHNDEVPEILAVKVDKGLDSYLDWLKHTLISNEIR